MSQNRRDRSRIPSHSPIDPQEAGRQDVRATPQAVHARLQGAAGSTPRPLPQPGERRPGAEGPGPKPRQNPIARIANQWFDRVMGAVKDGSFADQQAVYGSHKTTRDFVWNSVGAGSWGMVFPILTMVATQLVGVEQAGMFSMAFVVGTLLMFLGNFGVRPYQVSDVDEVHSFSDYQVNRILTCVLMVVVGVGYCAVRGYASEMYLISLGVFLYKAVDALADVYEGRLQQMDKLYLAGISQTLRSVGALVGFSVALLVTHSVVVAGFAMFGVAAVTFVVVTWPLAMFETPRSRGMSLASIWALFKYTFPLFIALFLFNLIDTMPKFAMESMLSYDNQLYFNALYFPAQAILIGSQLVYKPLLLRMAEVWQDNSRRRQFDLIMVGILAVIVAITLVMFAFMAWVGISIMSFLYGIDFEPMRGLMYIMLVAGGVTAAIDFMYQVIAVMRRQRDVTTLYLVTFGFSLFVPVLLVMFTGLPGAVLSYLIIMVLLFVLLIWEYLRIRRDLAEAAKLARREAALSHVPGHGPAAGGQ